MPSMLNFLGSRRWTRAGVLWAVIVLGGCGGGDTAVDDHGTGSVSLRAAWEGSDGGGAGFDGDDEVPAAVQTVEVRITSGVQAFREFVDPRETRQVVLDGIPAGAATVHVFGYDVRIGQLPDPGEVELPPSFASEDVAIRVRAGKTTDAGEVAVLARPFVTDLIPPPRDFAVPLSTRVEFLLVTAGADIDRDSIDIDVAGVPQVSGGVPVADAELLPCQDGGPSPCGGLDRQVSGYRFRAIAGELPGLSAIPVRVRAADDGDPPRSIDFIYTFETASVGELSALRESNGIERDGR